MAWYDEAIFYQNKTDDRNIMNVILLTLRTNKTKLIIQKLNTVILQIVIYSSHVVLPYFFLHLFNQNSAFVGKCSKKMINKKPQTT